MCIDWQTVAAIASAVAALAALWVSGIAVSAQKESARPLPFIECGNYEDDIHVSVRNFGVGPFIIKSLSVRDAVKDTVKGNVLDQIEGNESIPWNHYVTDQIEGRPIGPQGKLVLIRLHPEASEADRMNVRNQLAHLTVHVVGRDVYGREFEHKRALEKVFGF